MLMSVHISYPLFRIPYVYVDDKIECISQWVTSRSDCLLCFTSVGQGEKLDECYWSSRERNGLEGVR